MFNLDDRQRTLFGTTVTTAAGFWLLGQIADSSVFERFWSQAAILTVAAGVLRVWILEAEKAKDSH